MFRKPFRLDNSDKNCPYIVIRSEKQTNREGKKYLLRIKSPWDYDEVFDDEDIPKIAVVDRSQTNNGINLYLRPVEERTPFPKGSIMIPIGDTNSLMARLIPRDFYTERDQYVLIPKPWYKRIGIPLGQWEKMNHIQQIRDQSWRFSKGNSPTQQFHRLTINPVDLSDVIKQFFKNIRHKPKPLKYSKLNQEWMQMNLQFTKISDIGVIKNGIRFSPKEDLDYPNQKYQGHPYITSQVTNNKNNMGGGISGTDTKRVVAYNYGSGSDGVKKVELGEYVKPNGQAGTIAFGYDGNPGHATYMPEDYYCLDSAKMIQLNEKYNCPSVAMFVAWMITNGDWRYQYKRKISGEREKLLSCLLPYKDGKIDVEGIKKLMKTLPKWAEVFPK